MSRVRNPGATVSAISAFALHELVKLLAFDRSTGHEPTGFGKKLILARICQLDVNVRTTFKALCGISIPFQVAP